MISINNLTVSYQNKPRILHGLNLEIEEGKIHGIAGLNGSGKTTLLNTLFGLKKPEKGIITSKNCNINKKHISYLTTENYFYPYITGREYLSLFQNELFNTRHWNELFGLPLHQVIDEYSSGMKKKLALMGVLKQDKPIMILDEPFNNLDIETNRTVRTLLLKMKENGKTIIVTSHIIETLTNLCDRIHYLENGRIKFSRDKTEFAAFESELFERIEKKTENIIDRIFC